jgi:hypothetical protein
MYYCTLLGKSISIGGVMGVLRAVAGTLALAFAGSAACAAPIEPDELFAGCTKLAALRSPASSSQPATINFLNKTTGTVNIIWIDFGGSRKLYGTLRPDRTASQATYTGHLWLITDQSNNCLGAFFAAQNQDIIVREPANVQPSRPDRRAEI